MSKLFTVSTLFAIAAVPLLCMQGCSTGRTDRDEAIAQLSAELESDGGDAGPGVTATRGTLVISQVYGGGGNVGAIYSRDYVELFNRSKKALSLKGLSLQYASNTKDFGSPTVDGGVVSPDILPLDGTLAPGAYFLVALLSANPTVGAALPTADLNGALSLDPKEGKIAIAPTTAPLGCGGATRCANAKVIDLVGYGAVTDFEGTQSALELDATKAAVRKGKGCTDTDDNRADFTAEAPAPRNSDSAAVDCPGTPVTPPKDAGPTPPVVDPPLGDESDFDAGVRKDAGGSGSAPGADTSACAVSFTGPSSGAASAFGMLLCAGLVLSARRRRR